MGGEQPGGLVKSDRGRFFLVGSDVCDASSGSDGKGSIFGFLCHFASFPRKFIFTPKVYKLSFLNLSQKSLLFFPFHRCLPDEVVLALLFVGVGKMALQQSLYG